MSTPPRRRRTESHRPPPDGGGWLPTIAMGLAVIVAGLGIGALTAVLMQRHSAATPIARAAPTSTPAPLPTPTLAPAAPAASATVAAPRTPAPTRVRPTLSPSPSPSPSPLPSTATATPPSSPAPQATQRAVAPALDTPTTAADVSHVAVVTSAPRHSRAPTAEPVATANAVAPPTPVATIASPAAAPAAATIASPAAAEPSAYEQHASAVVRRYIDALIRGDEHSAYTALGQSTGATGSLPEQAFLDASAHIVSLKVTRIDAANATVGCEIASAKGHYYGTYHVTAGSGGAYISEHDYIKV